jgi:hypothetical protein
MAQNAKKKICLRIGFGFSTFYFAPGLPFNHALPLLVNVDGLPAVARTTCRLQVLFVESRTTVVNRNDVIDFLCCVTVALFPDFAHWMLSNIRCTQPGPRRIIPAFLRTRSTVTVRMSAAS